MKLHVLLLTALPVCLGQFSIQGPSDGNRRAQGLKYSQEKGIEYTDQRESLGSGDFTIQGATDGNSNFRIQGATDGHSDFQIQGASDGGASTFNIQGATDGHSQSVIQGPYDANQNVQATGRALQYNDPSGLRVNWRSYHNDRQPRVRQQIEPQYAEETAAPISVPQSPPSPQRAHPQPQHQPQQQPQQAVYRPYSNAPPQIKQLLQFQAQIPYLNVIPEPYRYDGLPAAQAGVQQVHTQLLNEARQVASGRNGAQQDQPEYRAKPRGPRPKRQAPQHQYAQQQQQQQQQFRQQQQQPRQHQQPQLPQYRRIPQPPAEQLPQYSTNLPGHLQELLKYQAQIPYNIIANQITYRPDKPYVPQPVQPAGQPEVQYQAQASSYQGQPAYTRAQIGGYDGGQLAGYSQGQAAYGRSPQGVRPVTENQY